MEKVFKALDDQTRRRILELLKAGDLSAGALGVHFPISGASMSHHLSILLDAELITRERKGQQLVYHLNTTVFQSIIEWLFTLGDKSRQGEAR